MPIASKLVASSEAEWARWGFSAWPLHGARSIAGKENTTPFVGYVNEYWTVVGEPTWNGTTPQPWSAAFISFCFKGAGAAKKFPYASGHFGYCSSILKSTGKYPLTLGDPGSTQLQAGDLLWAARTGGNCPKPPTSYTKAVAALKSGAWFCSHSDIVVAVRPGEVDVIGGNVSNSVTKVTYVTAGGCIHDARHDWIGVVRAGF